MANKFFQKLNFTQFVNQNVKILGRRLCSLSLKDVALLELAHLIFLIFHTFDCNFCPATASRRLSTPAKFTHKCIEN